MTTRRKKGAKTFTTKHLRYLRAPQSAARSLGKHLIFNTIRTTHYIKIRVDTSKIIHPYPFILRSYAIC